jgi:hypothetical protein
MTDTTKLIAFLSVVAYALGVVTVSFYLQHNDIPDPDLSLFKGHYIYTGLAALSLILLASGIAYACIEIFDLPNGPLRAIGAFVMMSAVLWLLVVLALNGIGGSDDGDPLTALGLTVLSLASGGAGVGVYELFGHDGAWWKAGAALSAIVAVGAVLLYASLYSRHIYPILPEQFGGGKPKQARLLFSDTGATEAQQLGIPIQAGRQLSRPVTLLFTGVSFYALRIAVERVVQIAKDDVNGLQEDSTSPYAADVQTRNRGSVVGLPEAGDELVLTFSEQMAPATLISKWHGKPMQAAIVDKPTVNGVDDLHFFTRDAKTELPRLGTVELRSGQYREFFGSRAIPVTIAQNSAEVIVKLKKGVDRHRQAATRPDVMAWTPSPKATDTLGNGCEPSAVIEIGSEDPSEADVDF